MREMDGARQHDDPKPHDTLESRYDEVFDRATARYSPLCLLFTQTDPDHGLQVLDQLDLLTRDRRRKFVLDTLFQHSHSSEFVSQLGVASYDTILEPEIPGILREITTSPVASDLLSLLWDYTTEQDLMSPGKWDQEHRPYTFALATLLTQVQGEELPGILRAQMGDIVHSQMTASPSRNPWYLCPESEDRLERATDNPYHGIVVVDNALLVKVSHGKITGLCFRPLEGSHGMLLPGMWYSPIDDATRSDLVSAYEQGRTRYTTGAGSGWAVMRPLRLYTGDPPLMEYLDGARLYAKHLPEQLPRDVDFGQGYRLTRREARHAEGG